MNDAAKKLGNRRAYPSSDGERRQFGLTIRQEFAKDILCSMINSSSGESGLMPFGKAYQSPTDYKAMCVTEVLAWADALLEALAKEGE